MNANKSWGGGRYELEFGLAWGDDLLAWCGWDGSL
jgi:hypothetical protein